MVRARLLSMGVAVRRLAKGRWLEWFMWWWMECRYELVFHVIEIRQLRTDMFIHVCIRTGLCSHIYSFALSAKRASKPQNPSSTGAEILVSNTILQEKEPGSLEKSPILGLRKEIYTISLAHLAVPESKEVLKTKPKKSTTMGVYQRDTGAQWKSYQCPTLGQFPPQNSVAWQSKV